MKRRPLLIAACTFAAVSVGLNVWLLVLRKNKPAETGLAAPAPVPDAAPAPVLQPVTMDFSDTAFADGSWNLTDGTEAPIRPGTFRTHRGGSLIEMWSFNDGPHEPGDWSDPAAGFDEPFKWEDVPLAGQIKGSNPQEAPLPPPNARSGVLPNPGNKDSAPIPARIIPPLQLWHSNQNLEVPPYLNMPVSNPNSVRDKALIAHPLPR